MVLDIKFKHSNVQLKKRKSTHERFFIRENAFSRNVHPQHALGRTVSNVHALAGSEARKKIAGIFNLWHGRLSAIKKRGLDGLCAYNQQCLPLSLGS